MARTKPTGATPPVTDPTMAPSPTTAPSDGRVEAPPATTPTAPATPRKDAPRSMRELRLATEARRKVRPERGLENPLREGLRLERVPEPSVFVLFGATGDLAHRKVVPALFQLWRTHLLPHEFTVICVGRRPYTDDAFRAELKASLDQFSRVLPVDDEAWDDLASRISYHRGDFNDPGAYSALADRLDEIDGERGTRGNRLFYL
ncbi:MAG TPA: hypothetical protein VIH37_07655, partial [Candidatus Limnocylindrales bacterium]